MQFLALATLLTGAFATEMSGYGSQDKSGTGSAMNKAGEGKIEVSIGVTVISSHAGGSADKKMMAAPAMAAGKTHYVTVGGTAGLVYSPETITADVGDLVQFNFMQTNHTVTQSAFAKPCVKMDGGVDSGFLPNPNNTIVPAPSYVFQVTAKSAVWFYCKQKTGTHCGKGMVFSINPAADKTHAQFKQMALQQNGTAVQSSTGNQAVGATSVTTYSTVTMIATSKQNIVATATVATTTVAAAAVSSASASSSASTGSAGGSTDSMVVAGTGSKGSDGSCSCSCLCGVAAFPANAGIGMIGGMSGSMPAS